jgi:hypothetical protein
MAFTRKFLSAMGVDADKIEEIITAHTEVVDHFRNQIDDAKTLKDEIEKLKSDKADLETKLNEANTKISGYEKDDYKGKYESEKAEHDKLKADVAGKEAHTKKESLLQNELKSRKFSDEAARLILSKGGYTDKIELDKNGKATNIDSIFESINTDFSMFTPKEVITSHVPDNPPANAGGKLALTWEEIDKIKDSEKRQEAMLANMKSLGI